MLRLLICDDQDLVREGLQAILKTAPDMEVVETAIDGAEALELIPKTRPDVVLMDLKMPGMNGIQATREIRNRYPAVRVLVLTTFDADEWVFDAIRCGASGYILKDTPRQQLLDAIRGTAEGKTHVDPAVAGKLFNQIQGSCLPASSSVADGLSEREREVLGLIANGLSNSDIAERLYLSEGTVRNYVSAIFSKLGVSDRTQAAVLALRHGLASQ
jgi:DNA-binding NarL/FixJ family response regulator